MQTQKGEAEKILNDVEQAIVVFGEIQQAHALSLQRNQLADVGQWGSQRSKAMGFLQQALGAVWGCDSLRADARLGRSLQQRIGQIVARERELTDGVKACQEQLKREMGKMRKGKKAIGSYGATVGVKSNGLCFRNAL